jgi:hypothetical protein
MTAKSTAACRLGAARQGRPRQVLALRRRQQTELSHRGWRTRQRRRQGRRCCTSPSRHLALPIGFSSPPPVRSDADDMAVEPLACLHVQWVRMAVEPPARLTSVGWQVDVGEVCLSETPPGC